MSNWDHSMFAPQGWVCPVCMRVYSPSTPMCYFCGRIETVTASNTSNMQDLEKLKAQSETTKTDEQK